MNYTISYVDDYINPFVYEERKKRTETSIDTNSEFERVSGTIIDESVYVPLEKHQKHSYQKNWNKKDNLIPQEKAISHIRQGGNIGLILGTWIEGSIYVLFDIEQEGILPDSLKDIIDLHTVISFRSPHGGFNRIIQIQNEESYELLNSYRTTISDIRDNDNADLELITNGASPLPPSEISHLKCPDSKEDCRGIGKDRYTTISLNPEAPPLDKDTVERIGNILELHSIPQSDSVNQSGDIDNVPPAIPKINIQSEFENHVPHVSDSFEDRKQKMMYGDWKGQERFIQLWHGNFEVISGSNKQGKAECILANYIGFWFGRNENMVRLFMSLLPFETHYEKYPSHRKFLLEKATESGLVYHEKISFSAKHNIAQEIHLTEETTVKELEETTEYGDKHIRSVIDVLEAEKVVSKEKDVITNQNVTDGYLDKIEKIRQSYVDNGQDEKDRDHSNVERTRI